MGLIQWATSPWGQRVPIHIAFWLLWVFVISALVILIGHAVYVGFWAKSAEANSGTNQGVSAAAAARVPDRVARHSLGARLFHWVMAAAMFVLLFTAFLPKVGVQFPWVTYHWIAGVVLTISVIYHVFHVTFWLNFWSIWPDRQDIEDARNGFRRALGEAAPEPQKSGKYPLENKVYHLLILFAGLSVIFTGVLMMSRVSTPFFPRNPYLFGFGDVTWGWMYVLHGFAGIGLVALIMGHVYFALRPEKLFFTKSMIVGWISREQYLEHYDPARWPAREQAPATEPPKSSKEVPA